MLATIMARVNFRRMVFVFVLILDLWVLFIVIHRSPLIVDTGQKILAKINGTHDWLITRAHYTNIEETSTGFNKHTWIFESCQISLQQLCNHPMFPKSPDIRKTISNADLNFTAKNNFVAIRLLGYIRLNVTDVYQFLLTSIGSAEMWLSSSSDWKDARRIATASSTQNLSNPISLVGGEKYYIEAIYVQAELKNSQQLIQISWKRLNSADGFDVIDGAFFSPYTNDDEKYEFEVYDDKLPGALYCAQFDRRSTNKFLRPEKLPYLERAAVDQVLEVCDYSPSYLIDPENLPSDFQMYYDVSLYVQRTNVYPPLNGTRMAFEEMIFFLEEEAAFSVINKYFEELSGAFPGKYELQSVISVERREDPGKGNKYFLELVVKDIPRDISYVLAENVFEPKDESEPLCYPSGMLWNRNADVYLILTAKNLGRWVHHFIRNVEEIMLETEDEHLHVVIFDFDSPDIDLEQALKRSTLKNYHFIRKPGNYSRSIAISEAVASIKDLDAIIVTIDLHLDIGSRAINDIRKHCIRSKTLYAPQIAFLDCDGTSAVPIGEWNRYSYGTVAVHKEDWDKFGGFSKYFETKVTWGGEDWDLIDGAVKSGLEIERKPSPYIYHYYHTKAGMWL